MDNERLKMEKLYAVITVARQVEGEYVFIKTERAFKSAQKADVHLKTLRAQFVTEDGKWKPQVLTTSQGDVTCQCEVGVFEIEVEEAE
jgi:glyoxylate utilization-related uncharacterized protein